MRGLRGRTIIVTGGGGGIGGEACRRLAEEGAHIAIYDRDEDAACKISDEIEQAGGRAHAFGVDIADYDGIKHAVRDTELRLGPIHALINNAGWDVFRPFLKTEPTLWRQLIEINLVGALNLHHIVLPLMVERGAGRVVNVASDAARVGSSGEAVYAACKAGLLGLSKTLAREHARDGITFNVVCPGPTRTKLFEGFLEGASDRDKLVEAFRRAVPMGRLGAPADLAGAIAFLASDDAAFITGQVISVSGGLTMSG